MKVIRLTASALRRLGGGSRIAVAGLNPHSGEGGAFGTQERQLIASAVAAAQAEGTGAQEPFPPDIVFRQAIAGRFDAVVCMYHDPGHIPMKLLDFEGAENVTIGLPARAKALQPIVSTEHLAGDTGVVHRKPRGVGASGS